MKYAIYQIRLTDAEVDLINTTQDFNSVPKKKAKIDMEFDFAGRKIGGLAYDAFVEKGKGFETTYKGPFPSFRIAPIATVFPSLLRLTLRPLQSPAASPSISMPF